LQRFNTFEVEVKEKTAVAKWRWSLWWGCLFGQ
jgi:hypothetical protein